jgi:hypothetical protein
MVRGQDYTATTGTTVTGLTALTVNDVVEVFSTLARTVADVYTQSQSDAKYALQTTAPAGAWVSWTPTVTSSSGTITSVTPVGFYTQIGKTVHLRLTVTINTIGTAGGEMLFTLPVAARSGQNVVGAGRENSSTGKMLQVYINNSTTTAGVFNFDNTAPLINGSLYLLSLTYEAA